MGVYDVSCGCPEMTGPIDATIPLAVHSSRRDDILVIHVAGDVDAANSGTLERRLVELLDPTPPAPVAVIDLTAVTFIGSAGLAVLVSLRNRCKRTGPRLLLATEGIARRAIEVTGLDELFEVYGEVATAVGAAN